MRIRADIEGSKLLVDMDSDKRRISYPVGSFSNTSILKLVKNKGSLGHAFTVCICTGNQNQLSFYPYIQQEISVLFELNLG